MTTIGSFNDSPNYLNSATSHIRICPHIKIPGGYGYHSGYYGGGGGGGSSIFGKGGTGYHGSDFEGYGNTQYYQATSGNTGAGGGGGSSSGAGGNGAILMFY